MSGIVFMLALSKTLRPDNKFAFRQDLQCRVQFANLPIVYRIFV